VEDVEILNKMKKMEKMILLKEIERLMLNKSMERLTLQPYSLAQFHLFWHFVVLLEHSSNFLSVRRGRRFPSAEKLGLCSGNYQL